MDSDSGVFAHIIKGKCWKGREVLTMEEEQSSSNENDDHELDEELSLHSFRLGGRAEYGLGRESERERLLLLQCW